MKSEKKERLKNRILQLVLNSSSQTKNKIMNQESLLMNQWKRMKMTHNQYKIITIIIVIVKLYSNREELL